MKSNGIARATEPIKKKKRMSARKIALICVTVVVFIILFGLAFNSMLALANREYYMSFGNYRLFPVSDSSLEPELPVGSLAVTTRPTIPDAIKPKTDEFAGTVIVFRLRTGADVQTYIGRVVDVQTQNAVTQYTVGLSSDGSATVTCAFGDIIGVYANKNVRGLGGFFEFFNSAWGLLLIILLMAVILVAWWLWYYVNRLTVRRKLEKAALEKSAQALSNVGLRYDNIHEITAVMDVLSMLTETPKTKAESAEIAARLNAFIKAENITLPQTPETAAILDSLPAPDTPGSLAAALASGATLRQSEDGQTLVLTTISGGKNILLTPVQTADGIILCQQGMRVKADLAPNIEDIGFTSMPASPEFFEGLPLEKNVEYPELPQPAPVFGTAQISRSEPSAPAQIGGPELQLSAPKPTGGADYALLPDHMLPPGELKGIADAPRTQTISQPVLRADKSYGAEPVITEQPQQTQSSRPVEIGSAADDGSVKPNEKTSKSGNATRRRRAGAADDELKLAAELHALLDDVSLLTDEEKRRIEEYRASRKKKAVRKPDSPEAKEEKKKKAKQSAERKKAEREAFLSTLSDEDREIYLAEQKLKKSREATVRKLKKMAADRKLLQKIDND